MRSPTTGVPKRGGVGSDQPATFDQYLTISQQVARLSLTNPRDAPHDSKIGKIFKLLCDLKHAAFVGDVILLQKLIQPTYVQNLTTMFSHSSDMITTPKIPDGPHDVTTPLTGMVCRP